MDAQYAAAYPELYRRHWWWRAREAILLRKIRSILATVHDPRILDVGCGAALFFDALESLGRVEGLEADSTAVERAGRWRNRIVVGELDSAYRPDAPFDLILMLDVLEHTQHPEPLLRRAADLVTRDGCVLVTVPAFKWLWTAHDQMNHHVTRYTARELRTVIARAGLVTLEAGYFFHSLVVAKLLTRAREAVIGCSTQVPAVPSPTFNMSLQAFFRAEHALVGWLPFGGSLFAIAAPGTWTHLHEVAREPW
jgi:2-polyprenyl-3-methyl-5-hydroxy-6-metoxy-1,4-benzoquinol methylase